MIKPIDFQTKRIQGDIFPGPSYQEIPAVHLFEDADNAIDLKQIIDDVFGDNSGLTKISELQASDAFETQLRLQVVRELLQEEKQFRQG